MDEAEIEERAESIVDFVNDVVGMEEVPEPVDAARILAIVAPSLQGTLNAIVEEALRAALNAIVEEALRAALNQGPE